MAAFKLNSDRYPTGTTVQVHPVSGRVDGAAPSSTQVTSASVAADGSASFTGLSDNTQYTAYAQVSGQHRYVNFRTSSSTARGGDYSPRTLANNTEYKPDRSRAGLVLIAPQIDVGKNVEGTIDVQVGPSGNTQSIQTLRLRFNDADATNAKNVIARVPFSFVVPADQVYKLVTANVAGTPTFTLGTAMETLL